LCEDLLCDSRLAFFIYLDIFILLTFFLSTCLPVAAPTEADDESAIWADFMQILFLKQWHIQP
jgi:hypothetical protein